MEIKIYALGRDKFVRECRTALGEVSVEGEPGSEDIVLTETSNFQDLKNYFPARVFVIRPPSLEVWQAATMAGVTVLSNVEAVVPKIYSYSGLRPPEKNGFGITKVREKIIEPEQKKLPVPVKEKSPIPQGQSKVEQTAGLLLNTPQNSKKEKKVGFSPFKRRGILICVYSLIGGVGKTTISLNLADLLKYFGGDPCLVDFDFNSAGATVYFWPDPMPSPPETILLWEDFPMDRRESRETVEDYLAKVPFGFHVLPAPKDIMLSSLVSDVLPGTVLDVLLDHFDHVIVDLGTDMKQFGAKKALSMADTVLLVARPDDVSVSGAVRFLGHVGPGKLIRPERLKFLVNRDRPRAPRRPAEVADKAGLNLDFVLPEDEQSLAEAAKRHTLPVNLRKSPLGDGITVLAEGIIPDLKVKPKNTGFSGIISGFISRLFKKKGVVRSEHITNAR
ncbi:MAG: CobQ/CobB/MinD/ParA nucleotide binding domain protein [Pelotomaculum sp. PtaB.Bin104]|nr:MAG: CobQ/CobB/MinD/ParA nucleotide binding domain protein [Pelotomaculum sp. PtaB.Bin104]